MKNGLWLGYLADVVVWAKMLKSRRSLQKCRKGKYWQGAWGGADVEVGPLLFCTVWIIQRLLGLSTSYLRRLLRCE